MTRALITGAAGFVGHHLVEHLLHSTDWELVLIDKLAYSSNGMSRLRDIRAFEQYRSRLQMFAVDVSYPISYGVEKEIGNVDYILHIAAESHVDRSIEDPRPFVINNVIGTMEMLQLARRQNRLKAFLYFSTDEVFGPCYEGSPDFKEWARHNPTNPYSASKACGDSLALAWANSYNLPVIVSNCMNIFGERQHPEKFIPMVVKKILRSENVQIHSDASRSKAGSRFYIHARNVASAVQFILEKMTPPIGMKLRDKINITGEQEVDNLTLVKTIHGYMEKHLQRKFDLKTELVDFHSSRPGHDLRYAINGAKLATLGWIHPKTFQESLEKTVVWMVQPENLNWLLLD